MQTTKHRPARRARRGLSLFLLASIAAASTAFDFERRNLTGADVGFDAFGGNAAFAQTTGSDQLTIEGDETLAKIDDSVKYVYFTGAYALTLIDGQTLTPIFVDQTTGATLNLGADSSVGQTWTITGANRYWMGTTNVGEEKTVLFAADASNPLGAYSTTYEPGEYSTTTLNAGSTLSVSGASSGQASSVSIGKLTTAEDTSGSATVVSETAYVDVASGQTLRVEDGLSVSDSVALTKTGKGTLQVVANGTTETGTAGSSGETRKVVAPVSLGDFRLQGGTFQVVDGTMKLDDGAATASAISLASGTTLDVRKHGTVELTGEAANSAIFAADNATINLYADASGYTNYTTTENSYIELKSSLLFLSVEDPKNAPTSAIVFAAPNGRVYYDDLVVADDLLGKEYYVDTSKGESGSRQLVLSSRDSAKFESFGKSDNDREIGKYLDKIVASGNYNRGTQYDFLNNLELNQASVDWRSLGGEMYASSIGFAIMNNLTTTQTLFDHLRDNSLAAFSGAGTVSPMDYQNGDGSGSGGAAYRGSASNGYFDVGDNYRYESGNDPYGQGYAPVYENGGAYNAPVYQQGGGVYQQDGGYQQSGVYQQGGTYNFGWSDARQRSVLRGQAEYGDPGTLIYSAWLAAIAGSLEAKAKDDYYGYDGKQRGFLLGLDLFGSCDCRFGAYYGYQDNEQKNSVTGYGKTKLKSHTLGVYHQFGDEQTYNIINLRGGYDRFDAERTIAILQTSDALSAKYNGYEAGASFEHGANFALQPFVFSPYLAADYNFLYRDKFSETSTTGSGYALSASAGKYHSLRGIIGGRLYVDMFPGEQQIRLVARLAYLHEFLKGAEGKTSFQFDALSNLGNEFDIYGNDLGRDWGIGGLGLDWAPIPAALLFCRADYLGGKYVRNYYGSAGLKLRW